MKEMRELKFRAWDDFSKKLLYDYDICGAGINQDDMDLNITLEAFNEAYILEQYTGLKDKNGKEVYEGDICKYSSYYNGDYKVSGNCGVVKYDDGCYIIDCNDWIGLDSVIIKNINIEIIGNIHENPELI